MSYRQTLDMPLSAFWLFNKNIDRIQSENDLRNLQTGRAAQSEKDGVMAFMESLRLRIGRPVITRQTAPPEAERADPDAKEQLLSIFGVR